MPNINFLNNLVEWFDREQNVESAVLFGSNAVPRSELLLAEDGSDYDFHVVARDARALEKVDWDAQMLGDRYEFQAARTATGGVRKITLLFSQARVDVVIVPAAILHLAALGLRMGLHRRVRFFNVAMNEMATCLHNGYTFYKGFRRWGALYQRVSKLPGVRMSESEIIERANGFLCDVVWVLEKLERGELVAAQHALHAKLIDTNLRLWRELRLKRKQSLPSFGLGRRIESLATQDELAGIRVNTVATTVGLATAAWQLVQGFLLFMRELHPSWSAPPRITERIREDSSRLSTK